jgi:hypothetical protein
MKLEQEFSDFLKNKVNLNKSRVDVAEAGIETMKNFLKANDVFSELFIDAIPQGSFRQETIIKPVDSDMDFDVDLLVEMQAVEDWEPKDYLIKLSEEFKATDRYKDLVDTRGKERCVTIDYENDFHIDVVPSITVGSSCYIMNKATNQFEPTDGDGYAEWFARQNALTGNKHLTKVTRLLKYIRDDRGRFETKSILLTTLLGNQVLSTDQQNIHYQDLATSFVTLMGRLDSFLQSNQTMPTVLNPVLSTENFNRKWTADKYSKFRDAIHEIAVASSDAYSETDEAESLKKWQKVFGDGFVTSSNDEDTEITEQESSAISLGDYSHRRMPTWPKSIQGTVEITKCRVGGRVNMSVSSNAWPIPNGCDLDYFAEVSGISGPYEVWWQVVNTGDHARDENCLRGNFEAPKDPNKPLQQRESSGYTGKHWIQCFIVKNGYLVAESKPFFLNVVNKKRNRMRFRR